MLTKDELIKLTKNSNVFTNKGWMRKNIEHMDLRMKVGAKDGYYGSQFFTRDLLDKKTGRGSLDSLVRYYRLIRKLNVKTTSAEITIRWM